MEILQLNEDTSIKNIREFHSALKDLISREEEVVLDFSGIKRLDLAVVQSIMAAHLEARKNKRALKLRNVPAAVRKQFRLSGLIR